MLTHLCIQNYALISSLDMHFSDGFTVLTGETGAGKSIILGALSLLMGGRADARMITEGEQKCVIEGEFDIRAYHLESFFEEMELDYSDNCTIRRELTANGKSRSFVNDTPVTLQVLKPLAGLLIDIHSQHQNLLLSNSSFCLEIVDSLANNHKERENYASHYLTYKRLSEELTSLMQTAEQAAQEADFIQFRYEKLEKANLHDGEMQELDELHQQLAHAEDIRQGLFIASGALQTEEAQTAIGYLKDARSALQSITAFLPKEDQILERIESATIELQDLHATMSHLLDTVEADPARLAQIEERQSELLDLFRQFGVESEKELIQEQNRLQELTLRNSSFDEEIRMLQEKVKKAEKDTLAAAEALTKTRCSVKPMLEKTLTTTLSKLGIAHAATELAIHPLPNFTESGKDEVILLFAANKNQQLRPVSEIASGGEMARLMLSIKYLVANTKGLPTIIFDEVDTGVSGEVASEMGHLMRTMAHDRQILAITHLPQIAAMGSQHLKVYKQDTDTRTETHIRPLNADERVKEIAVLLSGTNITPEAISNAQRLLAD